MKNPLERSIHHAFCVIQTKMLLSFLQILHVLCRLNCRLLRVWHRSQQQIHVSLNFELHLLKVDLSNLCCQLLLLHLSLPARCLLHSGDIRPETGSLLLGSCLGFQCVSSSDLGKNNTAVLHLSFSSECGTLLQPSLRLLRLTLEKL